MAALAAEIALGAVLLGTTIYGAACARIAAREARAGRAEARRVGGAVDIVAAHLLLPKDARPSAGPEKEPPKG
jgi:hypothetical protein